MLGGGRQDEGALPPGAASSEGENFPHGNDEAVGAGEVERVAARGIFPPIFNNHSLNASIFPPCINYWIYPFNSNFLIQFFSPLMRYRGSLLYIILISFLITILFNFIVFNSLHHNFIYGEKNLLVKFYLYRNIWISMFFAAYHFLFFNALHTYFII